MNPLRKWVGCVAIAASMMLVACGSSDSKKNRDDRADAGTEKDAGREPDCFDNPKTHYEIINACTDAQKLTKNPTLKLRLPDGGLPPLP